MTSRRKLIAGTVAIAVLAGGGAALAAIELSSSSSPVAAPAVAAPRVSGIDDYGLGAGRLGGRGLGGGLGPGDGDGGGFAGRRHFPGRGLLGAGMSAAATYLALTPGSLRAELASGQTLAQVTQARGKNVDRLVAEMVAAQKKALAAAVAGGYLTQAQADRLGQALAARTSKLVQGLRPGGRFDPAGDGGSPAWSRTFGSATA